MTTSLAITEHLNLEPGDVCTHTRWSPGRKIDPSTADAVHGSWRPASENSSGSWSLADLQEELTRRYFAKGDDMALSDDDVDRIARAVWALAVKPNDETPAQPARWWLMRTQLIARQYLGGWNEGDPPHPTVLARVDDNVKRLL
jgi:hypothetical protein